MRRGISLPGSSLGEEENVTAAGSRLSAEDIATLTQVAMWWRYRLARNDAADPVASLIGGVDSKGTATSSGSVAGELAMTPPLVVPPGSGRSLLVHACGRFIDSHPDAGGYSLFGLAHFYNDPKNPIAVAVVIACLPSPSPSPGLRAALTPGTNELTLTIVGVAGTTIEWTADVYWLGQ